MEEKIYCPYCKNKKHGTVEYQDKVMYWCAKCGKDWYREKEVSD